MPEYTEGIAGDGAAILKDGVPMSVSEVIAELNRANALEEALTEIRDYDPYKKPDAKFVEIYSAAIKETESCLDCKRARENRWPPSGLCSIHYRTVTRAREAIDSVFDHNQKYEPQNIARRVLWGLK